jgi:hypothetical protein
MCKHPLKDTKTLVNFHRIISSPNNDALVKEKYDKVFTAYRNLSSEQGVFGTIFSGFEKHESVVGSMKRGRCYDHYFWLFLPIFCGKIGLFLKSQYYDQFFQKLVVV